MTGATDDRDLAATVRQLVASRAGTQHAAGLSDDTRLGAEGLGFDSIAFVELLLECETVCRVVLPRELLAGPQLTVGGLIAAVGDARAGGTQA